METMRTRKEIMEQYDVDVNGIIRSPGQFESEYFLAPYFYDALMNGDGEINEDGYTVIEVTYEDRVEFPGELEDVEKVSIFIDEQGFVYCEYLPK